MSLYDFQYSFFTVLHIVTYVLSLTQIQYKYKLYVILSIIILISLFGWYHRINLKRYVYLYFFQYIPNEVFFVNFISHRTFFCQYIINTKIQTFSTIIGIFCTGGRLILVNLPVHNIIVLLYYVYTIFVPLNNFSYVSVLHSMFLYTSTLHYLFAYKSVHHL
jgi:hypothetical protein